MVNVGRVVLAAVACAAALLGCPDWGSFTRGDGTQGDGGSSLPDAETGAVDAGGADADADTGPPGGPALSIEAVTDDRAIDLTRAGTIDWLEIHVLAAANRCQPCARAIAPITTNGATLYAYADDVRTFAWSNGTPMADGTFSGGLFIAGIGSAFELAVTPNGERELLTMHVDTYEAGGTISARFDGMTTPTATIDLPTREGATPYAVRIHFTAPATARLAITYAQTAALPVPPDELANIAFTAATLAADL